MRLSRSVDPVTVPRSDQSKVSSSKFRTMLALRFLLALALQLTACSSQYKYGPGA